MLDGYRDVAKVFPCMHAWLSWKATRHARATVLCWCREKGKRGVTSPHRSSRRIRFVACASPCRARRLGYVAAGLAGAPRRDPCVAPSTTLICCWWCLVVVRTCASTHCSRAVCYCATLLVGACYFFSFFIGAAYIIIKTRGLVAGIRAGLLGVFGWDNHHVLRPHL